MLSLALSTKHHCAQVQPQSAARIARSLSGLISTYIIIPNRPFLSQCLMLPESGTVKLIHTFLRRRWDKKLGDVVTIWGSYSHTVGYGLVCCTKNGCKEEMSIGVASHMVDQGKKKTAYCDS